MKYQFFRIFLTERESPATADLFDDQIEKTDNGNTRSDFLLETFSHRIDFKHRKKPFVYIPIGVQEVEGGSICLGRIGREVEEIVNRPPEENFADDFSTSWRAANVLVDTRSDSEGQKIAFQHRGDVGKGLPILTSLANHLFENRKRSGWIPEINPMTSEEGFWERANMYKGEITSIEFTFVTPNVLRIKNKLNDELKEARKKEKATEVTVRYQNKDGALNLDTQEVRDAHEVTSSGGGKSKIKVGKRSVYTSTNDQREISIEDDEPLTPQKKSTWARLSDSLF